MNNSALIRIDILSTCMTEESNEGTDRDYIDPKALESEYENAKTRLDQQQNTLQEFSQEGMKMFRLLLLFVTVPTAVLGALDPNSLSRIGDEILSSGCAIGPESACIQTGWVSIITGVLLLLSFGFNLVASGYEARGIHNLTNPRDINNLLQKDNPDQKHWNNKLEKYQERIRHNDVIIDLIETLLALGKTTLWLAMYGVATITYVFVSGSSVGILQWIAVLLILFLPIYFLVRIYSPKAYEDVENAMGPNPLYDINTDEENDHQDTGNVSEEENQNIDKKRFQYIREYL